MIDHARFFRRSDYSGVSHVSTYIDLRISKCKRESESRMRLRRVSPTTAGLRKCEKATSRNLQPRRDEYMDTLLLHPFVKSFRSGALSTPAESTIFRVYPRRDEVSAIHQEWNVRASLPLAGRVRTTLRHACARARVCIDYTRNVSILDSMDGLDTQLPDTRISSRCGIAREGKVITCTHARNRSRATARGECKSNDVGPQGMTNNTPLALFLSLLSSYVRDIRPSHQFIAKHRRLPETEQMSGKILSKLHSYFASQRASFIRIPVRDDIFFPTE